MRFLPLRKSLAIKRYAVLKALVMKSQTVLESNKCRAIWHNFADFGSASTDGRVGGCDLFTHGPRFKATAREDVEGNVNLDGLWQC